MSISQAGGNYWEIDDHAVFDTGDELTLSAWIKWTSGGPGLLCHDRSNYKYMMYRTATASQAYLRVAGTVYYAIWVHTMTSGVWYHRVLRFDTNAGSDEA